MERQTIKGLITLQEELHAKILRGRSIESLITRHQFSRLWEDSTEAQQEEVIKLIENLDKESLIKWMREHPSIEVGEKSIRDLHSLARRLGIPNYSRLPKEQLVAYIKHSETVNGLQ